MAAPICISRVTRGTIRPPTTKKKRKTFNDHAWGLGYGRHTTDEHGNDEIVYGLAFSDSHYKPELLAGYAKLWFAPVAGQWAVAAGYTAGLTSRRDIFGGIPFPIVLPLAAVRYDKLSVMGTFIPKVGGGFNHGNVAFFFRALRVLIKKAGKSR